MVAHINVTNEDGETPLMYASKLHNIKAAELLIQKGSDINVTNEDGKTPLMYASKFIEKVAILLIQKGANINAFDDYGKYSLNVWCK